MSKFVIDDSHYRKITYSDGTITNRPELYNVEKKKERQVTVAKTGGDFTSVKSAMDSITDSSINNQYAILVSPGNYSENNPIQCKEFVSIRSTGGAFVTSVIGQNANQNMFDLSAFCSLRGLNVAGITGTGIAFSQTVSGSSTLLECIMNNCSNGILLNHASAILNVDNCAEFNQTVPSVKSICVLAGNLTVNKYTISGQSEVGIIINTSGSSSVATISSLFSFSANVTTGFFIQDQSRVVANNSSLVAMTDGVVIEGGSTFRANAVSIFNAQQDGWRINDVGANTFASSSSGIIEDSTNLDINILSATATMTGTGSTSIDKFFAVPGATLIGAVLDSKEDDEGFNIFGELHVGIPERGYESTLGRGDSYTRGMLVYTETDGGVFADVSTEARSASGSTFTFPDVTVNSAIYVASSLTDGTDVLEHFGIRTKVDTAAVYDGGNIVTEYHNGSAWVEVNTMETEGSDQYYPKAKNLFQATGSAQIRYNAYLATDTWTKNDPITPSIGSNYYWIRFRIETEITTAPIFQQFKLHTDRFEINSDGWIEYFGKSRPIGQLPLNFTAGKPFEGNMLSSTVYVSENVGVGYTLNRFTATGDKTGVSGNLPYDLDTSSPIRLAWSGRPTDTETITWTVRWAWVKDGDTYSLTEPSAIANSDSTTVSRALTAGLVSSFIVDVDISEMISRRDGAFGDQLWISIQPSTMGGSFALTTSGMNYVKWSEGGHI